MTYLYLEPIIQTKSAVTGLLFIILITFFIMQYVHTYLNWNTKTIQCKSDNLYIAYITGNVNKWWKKCVKSK